MRNRRNMKVHKFSKESKSSRLLNNLCNLTTASSVAGLILVLVAASQADKGLARLGYGMVTYVGLASILISIFKKGSKLGRFVRIQFLMMLYGVSWMLCSEFIRILPYEQSMMSEAIGFTCLIVAPIVLVISLLIAILVVIDRS